MSGFNLESFKARRQRRKELGGQATTDRAESGQEMLAIARKGRQNVRYALNARGDAIGAWVESLGRFVPVACKTIMGGWATMPYEILVNGKPIVYGTWLE